MPSTNSGDGGGVVSSTPAVLVEHMDNVLVITLNRPEARNAINLDMASGLSAALDELDRNEDLRVGVLCANGPAFCAGMDLKAFAAGEFPSVGSRGFAGITAKPPDKPFIAAVEGPALAGGFEVLLACDLIVASEAAQFGLPEVTRGLTAAAGGLFRLPDRAPLSIAMEMALTGQPVDAQRALQCHLVNRVVPVGTARAVALELAAVIASNAPLAVAATKRALLESGNWPSSERFARQDDISAPVRESADALEGAQAFAQKRVPRWVGR